MWRPVMRVLAQRFDVIAPDLRGAGGSQVTETGYDKASMAHDVHQLLEHLGVTGQVGVVGHDMGAGVAYAYAAEHREHVRRLGFLEFALPGFGFEQAMQPVPDAENWQLAFFASAPDMAHQLFTGREDDLLAWYFGHAADDPYAVAAIDRSLYARALRAPGALRAMLSYFATIWQDAEHNRYQAASRLSIPVLAVGGARSAADGPRQSMEQVADDVQGVILDGAGHWLADEQPDALSALLLHFLS
jgi:pimeloyl-ACP methyl ester carboxylesterase